MAITTTWRFMKTAAATERYPQVTTGVQADVNTPLPVPGDLVSFPDRPEAVFFVTRRRFAWVAEDDLEIQVELDLPE